MFKVSTRGERLGSIRLAVLPACPKSCCAGGWALGRKPVTVSATAVFSVSISHAYKKLGMNWEVWKER